MNFRVDSAFFVRFCDSPRNDKKTHEILRFAESNRLPRLAFASLAMTDFF
ncbi:hypothetical protein [Helicobacter sp. 23-1045]